MKYDLIQTKEFEKWFSKQIKSVKDKISSRLKLLTDHGYFGMIRGLDKNLYEFKWKTGIRVYFTIKDNKIILLLIGGNKNDQKKDITKAKKLQKEYF